jgi:predicted nucleic acid-binding protein
LDSWAWWEILHESPAGKRISKRYLEGAGVHVLTVDLAMAEISAKLARSGRAEFVPRALLGMEEMSEVIPITREVAEAAGPLLLQLRGVDSQASVADAVMLAASRSQGAVLVSNDPCFRSQRGVVRA